MVKKSEKNESPRIGISPLEVRLGVKRQTITRWVEQGYLPKPHYMGQRRAWFVAEIERFEAGLQERVLPAGRYRPAESKPSKTRACAEARG